jgi:predicted metalloprotease
MWKDDGAYDFEGEIFETIEHELEHHVAHLVGHDPKDEEERDEIAREARRVVGKKALARATTSAFASDVGEFWKRTWLVWVLALIAVAIAILASR